jgi:hypothetical protein
MKEYRAANMRLQRKGAAGEDRAAQLLACLV